MFLMIWCRDMLYQNLGPVFCCWFLLIAARLFTRSVTFLLNCSHIISYIPFCSGIRCCSISIRSGYEENYKKKRKKKCVLRLTLNFLQFGQKLSWRSLIIFILTKLVYFASFSRCMINDDISVLWRKCFWGATRGT